MPTFTVHVFGNHPLSRLHPYLKVPIGHKIIGTSIEMGSMFLALKCNGRPDVADALLENEDLKWQPEKIRAWIREKKVDFGVDIIAQTENFYRAVLKQQFKKESDFARTYRKALKHWDGTSPVEFLVYTGTGELSLTVGLRYSQAQNVPEMPGFNVYGKLLGEMLQYRDKTVRVGNSAVTAMLNGKVACADVPNKSILVIADSQPRYFDTVTKGDVVPLGGAKYEAIVNELNSGKYNFDDYKWIVVYAGTNVKLTQGYRYDERQYWLQKLVERLADIAEPRASGTVLMSCAFDHPSVPGNKEHARDVERMFASTKVECLNWSNPPGNPFMRADDRDVERKYFEAERRKDFRTGRQHVVYFHLNHFGLRMVWARWCQYLRGLEFFHYKLSPEPKSIQRMTYEAEHREQKRQRLEHCSDSDQPCTSGELSHSRRVYDPEVYGEPCRKRLSYDESFVKK